MIYKSMFAVAALALSSQSAMAQQFNTGIPAGWTCIGGCGASPANGVVTAPPSPLSTQYGWVSTNGGVNNVSPFGISGTTNGSKLTSVAFVANVGDLLEFDFNYVTSDGSQYNDYGWSRLLNADSTQAAILFTARTSTSGSIIPGFGMPAPSATLTPPSVPIIVGSSWAPLGGSSGTCYGAGCGHTGWVHASYTIATAGSYLLEFGAANLLDTAYQSGMAFDGAMIQGQIIGAPPVPEPETYAMLLAGLGLMGFTARRKKKNG